MRNDYESDLDRDRAKATGSEDTYEPVARPGRASASARLDRKANATSSGLIARSAYFDAAAPSSRDSEGVTADADEMVARAGESSGDPLPDALRASFEATLGVGLGGVRVHTGAASAAAADAVDAHAYAIGNDIHFGAGTYDPTSSHGQRLIAHEVVHTVQQAGSAPKAAQFKLRVSSPGDAHEVEADTLADRMVAGAPASTTALSRVATGIHRWKRGDDYGFDKRSDIPEFCKPNPKCIWNATGPMDYVAKAQASGPSNPSPANITIDIPKRGWPKPANGLGRDGREYELPPGETLDKAMNAIDALRKVGQDVTTTHNTAAVDVRLYNDANSEVAKGGALGPSPDGVNWQAGKSGKEDLSDLADQQTPNGGGTSIGDLYKPQQSEAPKQKNPFDTAPRQDTSVNPSAKEAPIHGISDKTVQAGKVEEVSKALDKAKLDGDQGVKDSIVAYGNHISSTILQATNKVKDAYAGLAIEKAGDDAEAADKKKKTLEAEKAEVIGVISGAGTVIAKGAKVLTGDLDTITEGIVFAADKVISGTYYNDIKAQEKAIEAAKGRIKSIESAKVARAVESAEAALRAATAELPGKAAAVAKALKARQDLYDNAAKLAHANAIKRGASPAEADRMRTAVAAIPRIELVVSRLEQLIGKLHIPTYNAQAGLAFAVAQGRIDTDELVSGIGTLKTWYADFNPELTKWKSRLISARQVADGLNVPGT